jgi:hypothetical protein
LVIVANSGGIVGLSGCIPGLNRGSRLGLRLATLKVFPQCRRKARPLPGAVIVRRWLALVVVSHAKRLRHFRPCGKDRAIRGQISSSWPRGAAVAQW